MGRAKLSLGKPEEELSTLTPPVAILTSGAPPPTATSAIVLAHQRQHLPQDAPHGHLPPNPSPAPGGRKHESLPASRGGCGMHAGPIEGRPACHHPQGGAEPEEAGHGSTLFH